MSMLPYGVCVRARACVHAASILYVRMRVLLCALCVCARARVSVGEHLCTCCTSLVCLYVSVCLYASVCPPGGTRRAMSEPYFLRTGQARLSQVKVAFSTRMASPAHDKAQYRWSANTVTSDTDNIGQEQAVPTRVLTAPISC